MERVCRVITEASPVTWDHHSTKGDCGTSSAGQPGLRMRDGLCHSSSAFVFMNDLTYGDMNFSPFHFKKLFMTNVFVFTFMFTNNFDFNGCFTVLPFIWKDLFTDDFNLMFANPDGTIP